jgi:hypothetical protein
MSAHLLAQSLGGTQPRAWGAPVPQAMGAAQQLPDDRLGAQAVLVATWTLQDSPAPQGKASLSHKTSSAVVHTPLWAMAMPRLAATLALKWCTPSHPHCGA